ncbi:SirB2 family protein [Pseudidiomarina aestuarii]|uniref:SirB2 family protein n=1 Tax=Pseudidiomarina aestuarii TaxID=624146 RepID=UPI003A98667D
MPYEALKHLHVTIVAVSVLLFVVRFFWRATGSSMAAKKWVKIVPHIIDTLLLLSIVGLLLHWQQWPWETPWLTNKLIGLVGYIVFGIIAMKATVAWIRYVGFVGALAWIMFLVHVAFSKTALI